MNIPLPIIREIRENADHADRAGKLTPQILEYMYEAKLFKLFVPVELGGLMLSLPEALKVFEKTAWIDGSFGWLVTIGSGGGFFSAALPLEQSRLLFSNPKALVAGSGHPNGTAIKVEGGYRVSGKWKYCSGSTYASLFTANCRIAVDSALTSELEPVIRSFAFLPEQVRIIPDWNSFGLKATESHSITVEQAYVLEERSFDILSEPHYDDPIFRYPFLPFAQASFAAVCLGIGRHYLEEARKFAELRQEQWELTHPKRLAALTSTLQIQETLYETAATEFYEAVNRTWTAFVGHGSLSEQEKNEVSHCSKEAARVCLTNAQEIFPFLGMTVLMEDQLLNRLWRDIHTAAQHSVLASV